MLAKLKYTVWKKTPQTRKYFVHREKVIPCPENILMFCYWLALLSCLYKSYKFLRGSLEVKKLAIRIKNIAFTGHIRTRKIKNLPMG